MGPSPASHPPAFANPRAVAVVDALPEAQVVEPDLTEVEEDGRKAVDLPKKTWRKLFTVHVAEVPVVDESAGCSGCV
jgi:hypothetical protein